MGVTYKLTQEVIDFILQQKKENNSLSCRTIAEIAKEKFQRPISKSSVNDVLKEFQLSSGVGRRSGTIAKQHKFTIPQERKEAIRHDVLKITDVGEINGDYPEIKKEIKKRSVVKRENKTSQTSPLILDKTKLKIDQNLSLELQKINEVKTNNSIEEFLPKIGEPINIPVKQEPALMNAPIVKSSSRRILPDRKGHLYNGMGFILLKAAEWEVSDKSFLGSLFKKYIQGALGKDFENSCEALMILRFLGTEDLEDNLKYRHHALWRLSGFSDQLSLQNLYDWTKFLQAPQNLITEYLNECEQVFFEACGFRLVLNDESSILVDFSHGAVYENIDDEINSVAMTKALSRISEFLVSPTHTMIFHLLEKEGEFTKSFWNLICALENIIEEKKIKFVEILAQNGMKMATFPTVLNKKRAFITGISYWQKEFKELTKSLRWAGKKKFVSDNQKQDFYFTDTQTDWMAKRLNLPEGNHLRLITFWQENSDDPFWCLLTNEFDKEAQEIIFDYLEKWPDFTQRAVYYRSKVESYQSIAQNQISTIWDIFTDYGLRLHQYAKTHFLSNAIPHFGLNDLISDIYSLPGYFIINEKYIHIILSLPPSFKYYDDLISTIQRINQAEVEAHEKKRLLISVDY